MDKKYYVEIVVGDTKAYYTTWNSPINTPMFNTGWEPFYIDKENDKVYWEPSAGNALELCSLIYDLQKNGYDPMKTK